MIILIGLKIPNQSKMSTCQVEKAEYCTIPIDENIVIHLFGTAHVSEKSALDVERLIRELKPNHVSIELCKSRIGMLNTIVDLNVGFFEIYKKSDSIIRALLSYFNVSIAKKLGTTPVWLPVLT